MNSWPFKGTKSSQFAVKIMSANTASAESPLLGVSNDCDEVELKSIEVQFTRERKLSKDTWPGIKECTVETEKGPIVVAIQGDNSKHAIVTYHDIGMNYVSNFGTFFNFIDMQKILSNFCVYHINAPGQEENAKNLPVEGFEYPSMDDLAEQLCSVVAHFDIRRFIGFGVGLGGNVLCRYALENPDLVDGLCLVNTVSTQAGWIEWGYQKLNVRNLRNTHEMTQGALEYLLWHHFGKDTDNRNHDLVQVYKQYFEKRMNAVNMSLFIETYIKRTDLNIVREMDPDKKKNARTLKMPSLIITGSSSPHIDDTVVFNGRLDPTISQWMKISDCAMPLEEQPSVVCEAFRLFIQGLGYVPFLQGSGSRSHSISEALEGIPTQKGIHITENPIAASKNPVV